MIGIEVSDIYLKFPEITDEEFDDLIEFIEDNNIRYEGATDVFIDKDKEKQNLITFLKDKIKENQKLVKKSLYKLNYEKETYYKNNVMLYKEILDKIEEGNHE